MLVRSLAAIVAVSFGIIGVVRAQESDAPTEASPTSSAASTPSKTSSQTTPRSPGKKKDSTASPSDEKPKSEQATFGAGCFWHVEEVFERLKGVNSAVSGYAGGGIPYPSYEMVHEGNTGHAEVVMVDFNPDVISYETLLKVFWKSHDPTSINRQGEDEGPQYRSVILYHTEEQRRAALKSYRELTEKRVYRAPIVTQLVPMRAFYRAEDYHQDYYGGKPRASVRRKATAAKAKKTRVAKGKSAPAPVKSADKATDTDAPESVVSPAPEPSNDPLPKR
jgi:peptide-methionine (S)-S-oxide reductase